MKLINFIHYLGTALCLEPAALALTVPVIISY